MEIKGYVFSMRALSRSLIFSMCLAILTLWIGCATSSLINAVNKGDIKVVRAVLDKGVNVNEKDEWGSTALHRAASTGNSDIVRILLDKGANVNEKDERESTALHEAVLYGYPDIVQLLLDRGANVHAQNWLGYTPLHYAAAWGYSDIVQLLLNRGVDPSIADKDGKTPLRKAEEKGNTEIVNMLRKAKEERYVTAKKPIPSIPKQALAVKPSKIEKILSPPQIGNYYAVVIGIGNYQDDRIPKLKYTTVDAGEIYKILTDPHYGNFPENQVKFLIDEQATYNNIKSAIGTWLKRNTRKNDTVIIFFAGHGAPEDEKTYWVTYNANIDDLYGTALSNDEIADMLDRVEAKKMIAFLDSCYSAATVNRTDKKRSIMLVKDPFLKFKGKGRVIITSSDGKEQSVEIDKFGHGIFTYYLLKALKGDADKNRDGYIELDEVWDYVKYRVTDTARKYGSTQTPMLDGSYSAGIVLSKHPERLKKLYLEAEREKKEKELASRIARLTELYSNGEITSNQFDKAVKILKSEKKNKLLDDFLADKISLTTFKTVFK
jgi:uncharacterized caspase-like protein